MEKNMNKINIEALEKVAGGHDYPDAPMKNCPYCMEDRGLVIWMVPVNKWSGYAGFTDGKWAWGYSYECPECGRGKYFVVGN